MLNGFENNPMKFQSESFWIKTDFLNLHDYISIKIVKTYYIIFYITLALFLVTLILLLFPIDAGYEYKTAFMLNKIDTWNKAQDLRNKISQFGKPFFSCDKNKQKCIFQQMPLKFQNSKYDYYWDDYENKYFESFWANSTFQLQEPLINDIQFPSTFTNKNYQNYANEMNLEIKYNKKDDETEYTLDTLENPTKTVAFRLVEKKIENFNAKCTADENCKELCQSDDGVFEYDEENNQNLFEAFCVVVDFTLENPQIKEGCFQGGDFYYSKQMQSGKTYRLENIKLMIKDEKDPYVISYSIGENGEYYDIKQKSVFANFLQYFFGFVTFLTICLFFFYIIINLTNEEVYVRNNSSHMIKVYTNRFSNIKNDQLIIVII